VGTLAVTQAVGYGVLFYTFAVFLAQMAVDLHTSTTIVTGAFTLSVLVGAAVAVPIGRWIDKRGGRGLMTAGSIVGTLAVLAWSQVHTVWQLYAVLVLIGLSSAAVLYDAAFAVIVKRVEPGARAKSILLVTIVAGFSSTIFQPLGGVLGQWFGWRVALLALGAILGLLTIVPHLLVVPAGPSRPHAAERNVSVQHALRDTGFWLLATAFTANAGGITVIVVHLVGYLLWLGHPITIAAAVSGLVGVMSVTGRVVSTGLASRFSTTAVVAAIFAVQAVAIGLLPLAASSLAATTACVLLFGLGLGVAHIARPALLAERYGAAEFGSITGAIALPGALAKAAAPIAVAAMTLESLPYFVAACSLVAATCLAALGLVANRAAVSDPVGDA
jgi:predicted MFS family arabinose efflux permease